MKKTPIGIKIPLVESQVIPGYTAFPEDKVTAIFSSMYKTTMPKMTEKCLNKIGTALISQNSRRRIMMETE